MRAALIAVLVAAGCSFAPSGVPNGGDALAPPDVPIAIDAHVPDAHPDARPDAAEPIDAAKPDAAKPDASDDTDGDGVPDPIDNCPTVPNPDQRDFDGDGHGDVCDKCPHIPSVDDPDADGDGVGDACDPRPGVADKRVFWSGFYDANDVVGWTLAGTWTVTNHALVQTSTTDAADDTAFPPITVTHGVVSTSMTPTAFGTVGGISVRVPSAGPAVVLDATHVYSAGVFDLGAVQAFVRGDGIPRTTSQVWGETEPGTPIAIVMDDGVSVSFTGKTTSMTLALGGGTNGKAGVFTRLAGASFGYLFVVDEP